MGQGCWAGSMMVQKGVVGNMHRVIGLMMMRLRLALVRRCGEENKEQDSHIHLDSSITHNKNYSFKG